MQAPTRVAVLASGGGSNLQALIDRFQPLPRPAARVELVIAGRPGIGALERAARVGIPVYVQDPGHDVDTVAEELLAALERHGIDLVVLAGYLRLIPLAVVERFHGRMLNIHPALLPAFGGTGMYGLRVHQAVLDAGVRVTGATVHLVDERYDAGAILAQWPVPVLPGDTAESLAARVLEIEHLLLPRVVEAVARGHAELPESPAPRAFDLAFHELPAEEALRWMTVLPSPR
ncbi:MAG TPA: phosphoribosylglycinamide formyltransferase [Longimicrobiaceae bacterium]|nr:phosphoribosylglycinamide formyltransferase [Longimicrobiaceae bacterium]